ncbi:MAG: hypothetical protein AAGA42_03175 [Actinomycetota bacterium]
MESWWRAPLRSVFAGHDVIVAGAVAAAWTQPVELLRSLGVGRVAVVATEGRGAGPLPETETYVLVPPKDLPMMGRLRWATEALVDPPEDLVGFIDEFDPSRAALVVGTFLNEAPTLAGRSFLAYRRPAWVALEDKVVADELWDRAGVRRSPSEVVPLADAARAARSLDQGAGTVWAADARDGFHGGGSGTRWVVDDGSMQRALDDLGAIADRVRVMPFLDGVPCSIHGFVLPDGVAVLRPVEMVVFRQRPRLVYGGLATYWDPRDDVRAEMRDVAHQVGEYLRDIVDFRGAFTIDGVATGVGFRPTELNPRMGAGLVSIGRATGCPMTFLNELIVAGVDLGLTADEIEADLVARADESRGGGTWMPSLETPLDTPISRDLTLAADGRWQWTVDGGEATAHLEGAERFLRASYASEALPVGPPTASVAARLWAFVDRELGTSIGALEPALPADLVTNVES